MKNFAELVCHHKNLSNFVIGEHSDKSICLYFNTINLMLLSLITKLSAIYFHRTHVKIGIEVGDMILEINGRPVKDISWGEQRNGLGLSGTTVFKIAKKGSGEVREYTLQIGDGII